MDTSVLVRQVYKKQFKLGLPGLAREVTDICVKITIPDVNFIQVKKEKIEEHIFFNHYKDMKESMDKSKKMEKIKHEDFTKEQKYLNCRSLDKSRTQLRVRLAVMLEGRCQAHRVGYFGSAMICKKLLPEIESK